MASPRIFQLSLRRAAAPSFKIQPVARMFRRRLASVKNSNESSAQDILKKQRLRRPVSPHLSIHRPNIALYGSPVSRISAIILSGGLYLFGFAYLAAPAFGWHLDTEAMVAAVTGWPTGVKIAAKASFAWVFFYHCLNGLRHLSWDFTIGLKNKTVARTGWAAIGLSTAGSLYYALAT